MRFTVPATQGHDQRVSVFHPGCPQKVHALREINVVKGMVVELKFLVSKEIRTFASGRQVH